jgi:hypothetical protein
MACGSLEYEGVPPAFEAYVSMFPVGLSVLPKTETVFLVRPAMVLSLWVDEN